MEETRKNVIKMKVDNERNVIEAKAAAEEKTSIMEIAIDELRKDTYSMLRGPGATRPAGRA